MTAAPGTYRYFVNWDGGSTTLTRSITITANTTVAAAFAAPVINIKTQPAAEIDAAVMEFQSGGYILETEAEVSVPFGGIAYQWYSNTTNSNAGGTPISGEVFKCFTFSVHTQYSSTKKHAQISLIYTEPAKRSSA